LAILASLVVVSACGGSQDSQSSSASATPRIYFVEPKDGATVKSPAKLKFGVDNYQIAAVPEGTVTTVRPGVGHYHVGVDQDCLPVGTEIVKGTPSWVHFGKGDSEIDMQLTPGQHKLSLAMGDDLHKTVPNLCQTITVTVAE
jgi:hypothetical protein